MSRGVTVRGVAEVAAVVAALVGAVAWCALLRLAERGTGPHNERRRT